MINDETTTRTIYVGNILTISDDELRDYFANLAPIETIYHDSTGTGDLWLVDYRFIRFSPGSDLNIFFNSKFDHLIGRIRLDIHPFDAVFSEKTRLISDRKICIAHTNPSLNRNLIKKTFTQYGKVINCNCTSSGNGIEYVYIEFESVNAVQSIFNRKTTHFAGKTSLAVRRALRPTQVKVKSEPVVRSEPEQKRTTTSRETACFSSLNRTTQRFSSNFNPTQVRQLEIEYDLLIQKKFDEMNRRVDKFRLEQRIIYEKLNKFIGDSSRSMSVVSSSSLSSSTDVDTKRRKLQH